MGAKSRRDPSKPFIVMFRWGVFYRLGSAVTSASEAEGFATPGTAHQAVRDCDLVKRFGGYSVVPRCN
jgi:hypothetical protein